ncbi:MAG TPA: glycoside hydrolase family 3 N-terminal domain-containing protein, partial [Vicinamibacteria bacterium]|nr:glycoside hydrolase family 3 N-terminal domain-containing protein [Vicinamibacteria bacterium]
MKAWPAALGAVAVLSVGILTSSIGAAPAPTPAAHRLSAHDAEAKALLAKMTLDEKVGQMTQAEQDHLADVKDIQTYFLGSVLSGGNSDPKAGNSLQAWTDMYDANQKEAVQTRLKVPILYGVDAVHGHNNVLGAVVFPHDVALGATRDVKLVEEVERITAEEVRATGIQWAFAPCVAVARDERWGRTYESFSEDPALVA